MSTRRSIPSAIEPYLQLPPETSLILLTGTLECSPNWLTARFVSSVLSQKQDDTDGLHGSGIGVGLVSWMRDLGFWKTEVRRTAGLDISKVVESGKLVFLDYLKPSSSSGTHDELVEAEKTIINAIVRLQKSHGQRICLILDNPDFLLATGSTTAQQLNHFILKLRSHVHCTVVSCSADLPLVAAAKQSAAGKSPPIEVESAGFITQQAHCAHFIMSVRELQTGAARDVSGVLRVTRSTCSYDIDDSEGPQVRVMEALYLVQRDGGVKIFERGADVS